MFRDIECDGCERWTNNYKFFRKWINVHFLLGVGRTNYFKLFLKWNRFHRTANELERKNKAETTTAPMAFKLIWLKRPLQTYWLVTRQQSSENDNVSCLLAVCCLAAACLPVLRYWGSKRLNMGARSTPSKKKILYISLCAWLTRCFSLCTSCEPTFYNPFHTTSSLKSLQVHWKVYFLSVLLTVSK